MEFLKAVVTSDVFMAGLVAAFFAALASVPALAARLWKLMGRRLSAADLQLLRDVATAAVQAAEQQYKKDPDASRKKLDAAMELASTQLLAYGIRINQTQLRAAVEASVLLMNAQLQLPPPPPPEPATTVAA